MRVVSGQESTQRYGGNFTGRVGLAMLSDSEGADAIDGRERPDVAAVTFEDGALTCWHSHPGGQYIWVVSGQAVVGTEADGTQIVSPGDLVVTPPDESHWHGAAPGTDAVLLCFTYGTTDWTDREPTI